VVDDMLSLRLDVALPAEPRSLARARRLLDVLPPFEGREGLFLDLRLVLSELVANAIVHGAEKPADTVGVGVDLDPERLRIEVTDRGGGFDLDRRAPLEAERPAGRGLHLVDALCDRWGVDLRGSTCVWVEFDLRPT
jgi:anti-sigma regulatory factor (Ser/Thr protein kinase)